MALNKVFNFNKSPVFRGYDKRLDKKGEEIHTFYYPHSDEYDLRLELLTSKKNTNDKTITPIDIKNGSVDIKLPESIDKTCDIYYRFKLTDKNDSKKAPIYAIDNGLIKNLGEINGSSEPFNQIHAARKIVSKPGIMQLQIPDTYYPGVEFKDGNYKINKDVREKAISILKNHVNKLGGTLNGMTYMLPQKAKEGYTRIVGTPFTKDEISSHLYWTQNAYQMASSVGNMQDLKRFQQALFKNGINFVADAALVNEGLQGIHFSNLLKWGENSPFFTWFKTYDLDSKNLSLGVLPENSKNVRMRIINSPIKTEANPVVNYDYDSKKPTYVQIYDNRLTTPEQEKANKVFTKYEISPKNHYEITSYSDVIFPYAFEVNPNELIKNIKKYNATQKGDFANNEMIMNVLNFNKFQVGERKNGGVELWDGNVDITKLNFSVGNYDNETLNKAQKLVRKDKNLDFRQGVREVQDYAVLSGNYWAKLSADTQLEFAANVFKNINSKNDVINKINEQCGNNLPIIVKKVVDDKIIDNVLNNNYNLFKLNNISSYTLIDKNDVKIKKQTSNYQDILTKSIMNVPFESIEVGDDLSSILSTGYLTKRAATDEQIGLSRFDIFKSNYPNLPEKYAHIYKKTDKILAKNVYEFIDKIITNYEKFIDSSAVKSGDNATDFGKYAINAVASDLTKYAVIKALDKDANITIEDDGSLNFDNVDRDKLTTKALDIEGKNPQEEIEKLVNKLEKGLSGIVSNQKEINKLAIAMNKRLKGLNEKSFKIADMIIDRTESGMGLRVDAAKDIASFDSVRENKDNTDKAWKDVLTFWSKYVKEGIQKENPHAYTTAEVTDMDKFITPNTVGDLVSDSDANRKMLEKVGVTSIANYSYFFSMPTGIYSMNPESGDWNGFKNISNIKSKVDCLDNTGWKDNSGFIFEGMPDSSIHSYTFVGNHDKPRILHVLGLDMAIYNSDLEDEKFQGAAKYVFNVKDDFNQEDISKNSVSAPAVAMGKRVKDIFREMAGLNEKEELKKNAKTIISKDEYEKLSDSIADLARGIYRYPDGRFLNFNPDSFGEKPFDVVIDDIFKTANLDADKERIEEFKNITLEKMLVPAMEKFKSIYKMLVLLPGDPTDFAGDKEGMTGFESLAKNETQQNRNAIRWEWLDKKNDKYKEFIAKYKKEIDAIMSLRKDPKLSALNDGHTVSLVNYNNPQELAHSEKRDYSANIRYNKDSMVITVFGRPDLGEYPEPGKLIGERNINIDYINLGKVRSREGLSAGLKEGTIFKNANPKDKFSIYKVEKMNVKVPKETQNHNDPSVVYSYEYIDDEGNLVKKSFIEEEAETYVLKHYMYNRLAPIVINKKDDNALVLYRI